MGLCYVPDCDHTGKHGCKMFKFPQDISIKKKWESLIRRSGSVPTRFSVVCSCHFAEGKKENLPTLFARNKYKLFDYSDPEKRKRKNRSSQDSEEVVAEPNSSTSSRQLMKRPAAASTSASVSHEPGSSSIMLDVENYFLKKEVEDLQKQLNNLKLSFGIKYLESDDHLLQIYTGIPNIIIFQSLYKYLIQFPIKYYEKYEVSIISKENQLLLCLMKLKLNLLYEDLAARFGISKSLVSTIFITWVHVLHYALYEKLLKKKFPSTTKIQTCLPSAFASFTNCKIILDCTEVYTEVPQRLDQQKSTYSSYKHRTTLKGLVGVAPNGVIIFVSDLYVGNTSDKKIVEKSEVLKCLKAGDLILADKGFLISNILPAGVSLNIPPFLVNSQFTSEEIKQTTVIAQARIHVERAIRRMKVFKILTLIPSNMRPYSSKIFQTIGCLINLNYPLLREVESLYCIELNKYL